MLTTPPVTYFVLMFWKWKTREEHFRPLSFKLAGHAKVLFTKKRDALKTVNTFRANGIEDEWLEVKNLPKVVSDDTYEDGSPIIIVVMRNLERNEDNETYSKFACWVEEIPVVEDAFHNSTARELFNEPDI
jgi:hypothetical protein